MFVATATQSFAPGDDLQKDGDLLLDLLEVSFEESLKMYFGCKTVFVKKLSHNFVYILENLIGKLIKDLGKWSSR